jgi:hypothetical protein
VLAAGVLAANGLVRRWLRAEKPAPGE